MYTINSKTLLLLLLLDLTFVIATCFLFTYIPVKPLTVQILNPPTPLVAERRYEVACESAGSRPSAIITWYKGKRQLRRTKVSESTTNIELFGK